MTDEAHWTGRDLALWIVLVAILAGLALLVVGAHPRGSTDWRVQPTALAALGGGLFGAWLLGTSRLLVCPRGSLLHEVGVAAVAAGPPSLLVGLWLAWSSRHSLAPPGVLVPGLATVGTPVLVGCLATLAWRLGRGSGRAARRVDTAGAPGRPGPLASGDAPEPP